MKKIYLFALSIAIAQIVCAQSSAEKNNSSLGTTAHPTVVPMNGNGSLGQTYNNSACGLNYVQASVLVETRSAAAGFNANGTGLPTTLGINGLPPSYTIVQAYVWYVVSYQSGTVPVTTVNITNPFSISAIVPATNIGQDQNKCWGETGTVVYRADVTSNISGNGNYTIDISGLSNPNWETDGVTLFIIYRDLTATYQGSFVIWDGDMTGIGNNYTQTMTGFNACANSSYANAFLIVSDMQDNVNGNQHPSTLNGVTSSFSNDMWNFDDTATIVTSGQSTATFGTDGLGSDCFTWAMMGLYYQTTNCVVCSPCTTTTANIDSVITASSCLINDGAIYISDSTIAPPLTYLWSNGATTQDVTGLSSGIYSVAITDTTGCSFVLYITASSSSNLAVSINLITYVSCSGGNNGAIDVNVSGGTTPYTYTWSNGATTQDANGLSYGSYTLTVTDAIGCSVMFSSSVQGASNLPVPDICMVTVDSLSQNNVIMWDKQLYPDIDSVIVYREIATNNYQPIGAVSYDSLSLFIDTVRTKYFPNTGNPNAGTYRYKIQLRDSCGNYSALSPYHNTLFMTNNNGNFSWQLYTIENGPNPVNAYVLMRDDYSNGNWNAINSVAGTQQTVSDPAYNNWQSTASYRIQTIWNITCTPTRVTQQIMASYNSSKSNISGLLSSMNETSLNELITVFPNPTTGIINIYFPFMATEIFITDVVGKKVFIGNKNENTFDISAISKGIYFLSVRTENGIAVRKMVKE